MRFCKWLTSFGACCGCRKSTLFCTTACITVVVNEMISHDEGDIENVNNSKHINAFDTCINDDHFFKINSVHYLIPITPFLPSCNNKIMQ